MAETNLDNSVVELHGISAIALPLSLVTMGDVTPAVRHVIEAIEKVSKSP
jgi:hypothetical protein